MKTLERIQKAVAVAIIAAAFVALLWSCWHSCAVSIGVATFLMKFLFDD